MNSNSSSSNSSSNSIEYAAWNTANPHQTTVIHTPVGTAYWTCIFDSADDKGMVTSVDEDKWIDFWQKYTPHDDDYISDDIPFPYLRCQKGAGN